MSSPSLSRPPAAPSGRRGRIRSRLPWLRCLGIPCRGGPAGKAHGSATARGQAAGGFPRRPPRRRPPRSPAPAQPADPAKKGVAKPLLSGQKHKARLLRGEVSDLHYITAAPGLRPAAGGRGRPMPGTGGKPCQERGRGAAPPERHQAAAGAGAPARAPARRRTGRGEGREAGSSRDRDPTWRGTSRRGSRRSLRCGPVQASGRYSHGPPGQPIAPAVRSASCRASASTRPSGTHASTSTSGPKSSASTRAPAPSSRARTVP